MGAILCCFRWIALNALTRSTTSPGIVRVNRILKFLASLFVNNKKWPWQYTVIWMLLTGWYGWLYSPIVIFQIFGVPPISRLEVLEGTLKIDGSSRYFTRSGPRPRYVIKTKDGEIRVHCGPLPHPMECFAITHLCKGANRISRIWFDSYFGILQTQCTMLDGSRTEITYAAMAEDIIPKSIGRDDKGASIVFPLLILIYLYQIRRQIREQKSLQNGKGC